MPIIVPYTDGEIWITMLIMLQRRSYATDTQTPSCDRGGDEEGE